MDFKDQALTYYMTIFLTNSKELHFVVTFLIGAQCQLVCLKVLFALYINDLPTVVKYYSLDLYADDAEMHCSHSD